MTFKFKTLSMVAAMAALVMTSCSSEEPVTDGPQVEEGEGIGYMAFTINTDNTRTRADEEFGGDYDGGKDQEYDGEIFNSGDSQEFAICPNAPANLAIFFSGNKFYGASNLSPINAKDDNNHNGTTHPDQGDNKYPEQFYTYITRWRNSDASSKPNQVLVLLNVNPDRLAEITDYLKDLDSENDQALNETLSKLGKNSEGFGIYHYGGEDYFSMSNAAFYNEEGNTTVTEVKDFQICETPEQALANRVTVYVERMLAKFEVTFADKMLSADNELITPKALNDEGDLPVVYYVENYSGTEPQLDYPDYKPKEWKVYVANWGINAVEPESYYFKNVNSSNQKYFGDDVEWNFPALHRSYWGETPNYKNNEKKSFPTQYRVASSDPEYAYYEDQYWGQKEYNKEQTNGETALTYYSFNHFTTRAKYKYAPERTYNAKMGLEKYGPYRFASHILIGAQLVIDGVDDAKTKDGVALKNVSDKYAAYGFYFGNEESYIRYAYRRMVTQFADGRKHVIKGTVYQADPSSLTLYANKNLAEGSAITPDQATKYFITEPAKNIHGDGKVVIALNGKVRDKLYYKDAEGNPQELGAEALSYIIYYFSEAARHFKNGKMYYAIPVQHKLGKSNGEMVTIDKDNGEYKVGQFGTVRNHWYTLNVKTIGSIGTSVDDPDQPIIPDPEDEYNVALEIVVLPWHKIDNGDVDL